MRDNRPTNRTLKIELLSQWKLEAELCKNNFSLGYGKEEKNFSAVADCWICKNVQILIETFRSLHNL